MDVNFLYEDESTDSYDRLLNQFIGHCMKHREDTCSQSYQDLFATFAKEKMNRNGKGFFVEFGAADSMNGSNTFILEKKYKWDGILAEPNPDFHEDLMRTRNVPISFNAISDVSGVNVSFIKTHDPVLSTVKGYGNDDEHAESRKGGIEIEVETVTLYDLLSDLKAPNLIDYISVDTEGSEYDILKQFFIDNKNHFTINTFTVEHNYHKGKRDKIYNLMKENGYMKIFPEISRWDDFYIRKGK